MSIKVVIDSASDISKEEAKNLGIEVLPLPVTFGNEVYYDGEDLFPNEFFKKLMNSKELPKTSQITPYRFEEKIKEVVNEGNEVIIITISSKLSNTYNSAALACQNFEGKAYAVDSLSATIGERLLCMHALKLIKEGKNIKDIVDELNSIKEKITIFALVDTLEYLKKGGRISSATAFAGELLSIKPIISVIDGEVKMIATARGNKKANKVVNEFVIKKGGINFEMPYGLVYSGIDDNNLQKYINESNYLWKDQTNEIPTHIIGSTIGTHVGPGAVGIAFFAK